MIALAIVALAAPVVGISLYKAVQTQRFEASVSLVASRIELAERALLHTDADIYCVITRAEGGFRCQVKARKALPKALELVAGKEIFLKGVEQVAWNGIPMESLELGFLSSGDVMPRGLLTLTHKGENRHIGLQGYPHPIIVSTQIPLIQEETAHAPYPRQVTQTLPSS